MGFVSALKTQVPLNQGPQGVVQAAAPPASLSEMQVPRPRASRAESQNLKMGPCGLCFNKPSGWFRCSDSLRLAALDQGLPNLSFN